VGLAQTPKLLSNRNNSLEAGGTSRSSQGLCLFYIYFQLAFHEKNKTVL